MKKLMLVLCMLFVFMFAACAEDTKPDVAAFMEVCPADEIGSQAFVDSAVTLATYYFFGYGVDQDFVKSYTWLLIAESYGTDVAELKATFRHMSADELTQAQALAAAWFNEYKQ